MKYNKEITTEIVNNLRLGLTIKDCCALSNINVDTFYDWKTRYPEFSVIINKALLFAKRRAVALIQKAGQTDWRALSWWLWVKYPEEFTPKQKMEQEITSKSIHLEVVKIVGEIKNQSEIKQNGDNTGSKKYIRKQVVEGAELIQNKKQKKANHKSKIKHDSKTNLRRH